MRICKYIFPGTRALTRRGEICYVLCDLRRPAGRAGGGDMFGLGLYELLFILVIALIVFGPGKLPQIGSGLGKAIHDFRKGMGGEGSKRNGEGGKSMAKKDSEELPR